MHPPFQSIFDADGKPRDPRDAALLEDLAHVKMVMKPWTKTPFDVGAGFKSGTIIPPRSDPKDSRVILVCVPIANVRECHKWFAALNVKTPRGTKVFVEPFLRDLIVWDKWW